MEKEQEFVLYATVGLDTEQEARQTIHQVSARIIIANAILNRSANIDEYNRESNELVAEAEEEDKQEQNRMIQIRAATSTTPQPPTLLNSPKTSKNSYILVEKSSVKKPPKHHVQSQDSLKQKISDKNLKQNTQAVKSILKHKHTEEKKSIETTKQKNERKHRFSQVATSSQNTLHASIANAAVLLSDQKAKVGKILGSRSGSKSIRFQNDIDKNNSECEDLERQFEDGMTSMKVKFIGEDNMKGSFGSQTQDELCLRIIKGLESTGGEVSEMDPLSLQNQCIKLKTDNEILNITLRHLQDELNTKTETIRKQQFELASLRQTILDLQSENYALKSKKPQRESEYKPSFEKENVREEPPKPIEKPLSPKESNPLIYTSFGTDNTNHYQSQQVEQQPPLNVFKRESSLTKQENIQKLKPVRVSQAKTSHFSPVRHKQSIESATSQSHQNSNSKRARVNQILGQVNKKIDEEFSSTKVGGGSVFPEKVNALDSEVQMQQFNEEFNKIFNIS